MTLLDTNVVSDIVKPQPSPRVQAWLDSAGPDLWISSVTVAELRLGVELMPDGKKKNALALTIDDVIDRFRGQCAPFDAMAAGYYARIVATRKRLGRPIETLDAQLASIALTQGFTLATLNTQDFEGIEGLKVINPST